jgi:paired amphipathic helix protein Sin3a
VYHFKETTLACSGRDELCRSVLNDDWVSHPTWASEESGFVAHKKNSYEEALHKSEEERHEYHVHLESMAHTISLLEPIAFKIGDMTPEERAIFRLTPDLGGRSRSIHQKIIKRVYGRENAQEVLQSLQDNPSVAVPVVLDRLKQVDAEWRKNKREWEKVWREVDSRNFYKSLDHQGVAFKANDKKAITGKALLAEIERTKEEQDKHRTQEEDAALEGDQDTPQERIKRSQVLPRHQLEYDMHDEAVLQDALKLTLCFLERNDQRQSGSSVPQYNAVERRRIEAFLRHYVMHQFGLGPEFDAAFGPPIEQAEWEDLGLYIADGDEESFEEEETSRKSRKSGKRAGGGGLNGAVSAGDLKKKLNKTRKAMEKAPGLKTTGTSKANSGSNSSYHRSPSSSRQGSPVPHMSNATSPTRGGHTEDGRAAKDKGKAREADLNDIWLRHVDLVLPGQESKDTAGTNGMDIDPSAGTGQNAKTKSLGSFFCNTTFYTLLRLLQVRLLHW